MIRPHVEIPVASLHRSVVFYQALFGVMPQVRQNDWVEFSVDTPPMSLKLVKTQGLRPKPQGNHGHFGIQLKSSNALRSYQARFEKIGTHLTISQNDVECCGSVQNKIWVEDDDGNGWELFVVVDQVLDGGCGEGVESCMNCPCNFT